MTQWTDNLPELPEFSAQLDAIAIPRRKTGVIVGLPVGTGRDVLREVMVGLEERFPDVTFALVGGAQSVAFEWEVDD